MSRPEYYGTRVSVVAAKLKLAATPEGQYGQTSPPSQEAIREHIRAGMCPWCARGPWVVLAGHTAKAHGIDGNELRDMAGLLKHDPICDPAYGQSIRERHAQNGTVPPVNTGGRTRRYSATGRARMEEVGRKNRRRITPEQQTAGSKKGGSVRGQQLLRERGDCTVCGQQVPYKHGNARQRTCSPECLRESKARSMRAWRNRPRPTS